MDKVKLVDAINSCNMDYDELYTKINVIEKENTNFNTSYYNDVIFYCLFLFHMRFGIEELNPNISIPNLFSKIKSYEQFKRELMQYKKLDFNNALLPDETNWFQEICRLTFAKLVSSNKWWTRIYSTSIYNAKVHDIGKIYFSIDNSDLYQFAYLLLSKCIEMGVYDFEFKVNNNESINRTDNVVIYFTFENAEKYFDIIEQIKKEHPEFTINQSHILGKEISNGVVIAKDYADGSSFTEKVCKAIIGLKKDYPSTEILVDSIDEAVTNHLEPVVSIFRNTYYKMKGNK